MRDKVAMVIAMAYRMGARSEPIDCPEMADDVLFLLREGIGKVESPWSMKSMETGTYFRAEGFERCRDAVLTLLKETSMSSQKEGQ